MTSVNAVIGTGFGDEGKGLMTDYLARQNKKAVVVRSNGGAQAGHTVTLPDGTRHIFSHFGSGTLARNPTYLSEFFVNNPMLWKKEAALFNEDLIPFVVAHPDGLLTTPYDVILNMAFEEHRGGDQHGSCGVGFGETIERSETFFKLTVNDLYTKTRVELREILNEIRYNYVPKRLWFDLSDKYVKLVNSDEIMEQFITVGYLFRQRTVLANNEWLAGKDLIFEGAQGLLLDQNHEYFPHVTRSNTGMKNVMSIIDQVGDIDPSDITVNYMSRAYTTRHGAGPLERECTDLPYSIVDETNIDNDWQGSLRFAPLNLDIMYNAMGDDSLNYPDTVKREITFTCVDQIDAEGWFIENGTAYIASGKHFRDRLAGMGTYLSFGPTHEDVVKIRKE